MALSVPYYIEELDTSELPRRFLEAFAAILSHSNYAPVLGAAAQMKAHCGRCADTCPVYQVSGEKADIPCERSEMLLRIYRRYFTLSGALKARFGGGFVLTDDYIEKMADAYYRCTACRRCKLECPMGLDHGLITHLGRWVLAEVNIVPKALVVATREQLEGKTGNTSAIPVPAMQDTCEFLEEDAEDEYGIKIEFPMDVEGADYVFFPAVSDYLLEPDTLMGVAAVLKATGANWTIGTGNFDGINYGLFYSDRLLDRIVSREADEVRRLKAKNILVGECGHASRSAKAFIPTFCGGKDAPPVINIMEYTYEQWKAGKLELKPDVITERVTYHDPCNLARSGWVTEQPREILKHICTDYVEMDAEPQRELLLRRWRRHGLGGRGPRIPHDGRRQGQGRSDPGDRREDGRGPVRQLQEASGRGSRGPQGGLRSDRPARPDPQGAGGAGLHEGDARR